MPGYLEQSQLAALQAADGRDFDATFVKLMSIHHAGAVAMADEELRRGSDFRLRLMAHAIRHEQQGEIALMQGVKGIDAVAWLPAHVFRSGKCSDRGQLAPVFAARPDHRVLNERPRR
jgi:hypothetical protein